jgi:hypothetical protein
MPTQGRIYAPKSNITDGKVQTRGWACHFDHFKQERWRVLSQGLPTEMMVAPTVLVTSSTHNCILAHDCRRCPSTTAGICASRAESTHACQVGPGELVSVTDHGR